MRIISLDRIKSVLPNIDLLSEIESGFAASVSYTHLRAHET